ncbi:PaaI family thioesterase [Terricaulis silvestris]|uniref:Acyl-coenzyme A thioesterase PaaI n=1 Tax=Terricaulis silvestris TaxID=2686094 RepID=A0A6I6MJW5_9CAUL|nr:PaaI family thioesterase [Terricaulis silvestris]QGZ94201.1 Acyl-coenzyme A thioesterase PaaI [Terricaulis silvestris]
MASETHYGEGGDVFERIQAMMKWTPQGRALGFEVTKLEGNHVWGRAPYKPELVGDPETGVIAGGVITTFLDQLCGMAAVLAMKEPSMVATIDIRIDYMRGATPGRDVLAEAHCYKIGRNVAFVRAVAFEDDAGNPIAHATATFMVNATRKFGANLTEKKS